MKFLLFFPLSFFVYGEEFSPAVKGGLSVTERGVAPRLSVGDSNGSATATIRDSSPRLSVGDSNRERLSPAVKGELSVTKKRGVAPRLSVRDSSGSVAATMRDSSPRLSVGGEAVFRQKEGGAVADSSFVSAKSASAEKTSSGGAPSTERLPIRSDSGTARRQRPAPADRPLQPLPSLPLIYNLEVRRWTAEFTRVGSPYMKKWLARSYRYLPDMKAILRAGGLPEELAYMTLVESGLSAHAVSSAKAVGYWQFIESTALRFGLMVNRWIDERKDFQKSTRAAGRYLRELYLQFQNWPLALAAYNMGEARLDRLMKKHKQERFWALARKPDFPVETAFYVPKVLAVIRIMKSPARYGFDQFRIFLPYNYDVFYVPGGVRLRDLAKKADIPYQKLRALNPDLKMDRIPVYVQNHRLRIPKGKGGLVSDWLVSLTGHSSLPSSALQPSGSP